MLAGEDRRCELLRSLQSRTKNLRDLCRLVLEDGRGFLSFAGSGFRVPNYRRPEYVATKRSLTTQDHRAALLLP